MNIAEYFRIALTNLSNRKFRAYLTMIGIFIGITAVVAIISLGQGLQVAIDDQMAILGSDKIFLTPGTSLLGSMNTAAKLTDRDRQVVDRTPGVQDSLAFGFRIGQIQHKDEEHYAMVVAATLDEGGDALFREMLGEEYLMEGRLIEDGDSYKAYVAYDYTQDKRVFNRGLRLGDTLTINEQKFDIVGFQKKVGNSGDDQTIYISADAYERVFDERVEDELMQVIIRVTEGEDPSLIAERIKKDLRSSRGLSEGDEDFSIETADDMIASFNQILLIVNAVIVGIAAISLVIGGIGIMNTMYTAVVERTQEIGIMKAIGARNSSIMIIFLIESGLLGLVGGIIGVAFGLGISYATEFFGGIWLGSPYIKAWWSWGLIFAALAFSFITGTASGLAPAWQASKKKPVESLRYE